MMLLLGILFAVGVALVMGLGHWYVWRRLVKDLDLGRTWRRFTAVVLSSVALGLPVSVFVARQTASPWVTPVVFVGFAWMGFLFYLVALLLLRDLVVWGWRLRRHLRDRRQGAGSERALRDAEPAERTGATRGVPSDPDRRLFLTRLGAGAVVLGAAGVGLTGLRSALGDIETPEVEVRLERLPRSLSGYRIAVLSDLHLGPTLGAEFVSRVMTLTLKQRPDLVVITGDLVDGSVRSLGPLVRPLAGLRARDGVFFVTGNHEYYSGVDQWVDFLNGIGIRVLFNERVAIQGRNGFDLAGVPDYRAVVFRPNLGPDPQAVAKGRDPDRELIVLAHQPVQIHANSALHPGLQISGHTHGGQIWPWGYMVRLTQPYLSGLHRYDDFSQVFVTRGTGYWGPPIRFLAPAEIPCLVLVST